MDGWLADTLVMTQWMSWDRSPTYDRYTNTRSLAWLDTRVHRSYEWRSRMHNYWFMWYLNPNRIIETPGCCDIYHRGRSVDDTIPSPKDSDMEWPLISIPIQHWCVQSWIPDPRNRCLYLYMVVVNFQPYTWTLLYWHIWYAGDIHISIAVQHSGYLLRLIAVTEWKRYHNQS